MIASPVDWLAGYVHYDLLLVDYDLLLVDFAIANEPCAIHGTSVGCVTTEKERKKV